MPTPFSIGKYYKDQVICDVGGMDTRHILLGGHDIDAMYKCKDNVYIFVKDGR